MLRFYSLLILLLTHIGIAYSQEAICPATYCIAVVDAGSTGSRVHVYAYDLDKTDSPVHISEVWSKKIKPGFASLDANSLAIDTYLTSLFADAPFNHIPTYFYATAGMRLIPKMKQKKYYDELRRWFSYHPQWLIKDAKTITGNEEGLYDWLAVNYHLGVFSSTPVKPVGVMDMGGASVQIAFPIHESVTKDEFSPVKITLYGQQYTLYVHSFLGLGQTELSHQFLNSAACFAQHFPLPDGQEGFGNAWACSEEVSQLVNEVHGVHHKIKPILVNNPVASWYSIGGIANLADSSLFHFDLSQFTGRELMRQADSQICQQQWETLDAQFPNDDYVYQYCLLSAYYYALIINGYGLTDHESIHYIPPKENVDWTVGVVLYKGAN